jgi:CDP-diacylglycerol--glycerol-3-phosphate 3-phosphatidyltransferase
MSGTAAQGVAYLDIVFRHFMQTVIFFCRPPRSVFTVRRFGKKILLFTLWACETDLPDRGCLPHISQVFDIAAPPECEHMAQDKDAKNIFSRFTNQELTPNRGTERHMIEGLRPAYNATLRPVARLLVRLGMSPDFVTVAGVGVFAIAGAFAYRGMWWPSSLTAIVGGFLDGLDGLVAREANRKTAFGAVLDSTCDRLTEILWVAGIMGFFLDTPAYTPAGPWICFAAITGSVMVSYVKARAEGMGLECKGGLMQRPERLLAIGFCLVCGPTVALWGLGAIAVLGYATMVRRLIVVRGTARRKVVGPQTDPAT